MDIAEKILDQIAHHRAEILRLESALQVFVEMGGGGKSAKAQSPMITIRKTVALPQVEAAKPAKAKKKPPATRPSGFDRTRGIEDKKRVRDGIIRALADRSMSTKELIDMFGPKNPDQNDKQVIYALMYELRQAGVVERQNQGTTRIFTLVNQPHQMAAAG